MSNVTFGEVHGDQCPACKAELNIEGEFFEGTEYECECGALVAVESIEAGYWVEMTVVEPAETYGKKS